MPVGDMLLQALVWQIEAGADEAIADAPVDRFAVPAPKSAALTFATLRPRPAARAPASVAAS